MEKSIYEVIETLKIRAMKLHKYNPGKAEYFLKEFLILQGFKSDKSKHLNSFFKMELENKKGKYFLKIGTEDTQNNISNKNTYQCFVKEVSEDEAVMLRLLF